MSKPEIGNRLQGLRELLEWMREQATTESGASEALREKLEAAADQADRDLRARASA